MRRIHSVMMRGIGGIFILALMSLTANAQFKASIQGTITDAMGAVIPGAKITLMNKETGRAVETMSSGEGFYRLAALPPGKYQLTVEREGFKKAALTEIEVKAEEARGLDVTLEAGVTTESVTVSATVTPALQTEDANVTRGVSEKEIRLLPQFGRDPFELLRLAPGVFGQGARGADGGAVNLPNTTGPGGSVISIFQVENQVPISANGQRVSANNYQLDGVSVNSLTWGGAAVVTPNQESVKELRVLSSSYSAEDGRNSGAQIKVVSQNGTNEYHGSAVYKYNDPDLNAFNKYGGLGLAPTRVERNFRQFGGSIGGPVTLPVFGLGGKSIYQAKDRLFFFFSYEGLRESSNNPFDTWIETSQFRDLVKSARPGSVTSRIFASPGIEPRLASVIPRTCASIFSPGDAANRCRDVAGGLDLGSPTGAAGTYVSLGNPVGGGFDGIPDIQFARLILPQRLRGNQFNGRIDYTKGNHLLAFSSYFTRRNDELSDAAGRSRPMGDLVFKPLTSTASIIWNYTISPRILNEARFNYTRFSSDQIAASANTNFGIPRIEVEGLPFDRIRFGAPWAETTPAIFAQNTFDFRDVLNVTIGNMAWKFGAEIRREQDNNNLVGGSRPLYSFVGLFNLANDAPIFESINADPATGRPANAQRYFRLGNYGYFAQNDWKVRPNFTLNLGVRYEYFTPLREKNGQMSNIFIGPGGLRSDAQVRVVSELFEPDRNNWAPRIGFAYSPRMFADKMVWRGGFGVSYNRVPGALFLNTRGNPPFFARYGICCGTASTDFGTPFVGGKILYALGSDNSIYGYPVNPNLAQGIDPVTGGVKDSDVEIYGTPQKMRNAYVYNWSLETQYELGWDLTATVGYQASAGRKLIRIVNQNFIEARNPRFFAVYLIQPDVNSNYNGMNARLSKRFSRGFQLDANYRWSKSIDTLSYEGPGAVTNQTNPSDLASERGPSDFDARHYFVLSGMWELPIFRGRNDVVGKVLGGWGLNGIWTANSGLPWTPKLFEAIRQPSGEFFGPIRPIKYVGGAGNDSSDEAFIRGSNFPGGGSAFFATTVNRDANGVPTLALNPPGIGRNSFRGPRFSTIDFSLVKQTRFPGLGEQTMLDLRFNFFNAFNLLNLSNFGFFDEGVDVRNPNFGRASRGLAGRVIEFQARLSF